MTSPADPTEKAKSSRENLLLLGAGLFYVLLYVVFWPRAYVIMDESSYLGLAYALRQGTVYSDAVGIQTPFDLIAGPHRIVMYPPGLPALYALLSFAGWKAILGINLVMHLTTFGFVAAILRRLRLPVAFALLYLLHPTAVIYSRTIMSDIPTGLLFAATFWCYLNRRYTLAGVLMGVALLIRNASLLGGPLLMLACLLEPFFSPGESSKKGPLPAEWRERLWAAIRVVLGWLPFFVFAYWYQAVVQEGGWHKFPLLKKESLPQGLKTYSTFLMVVYPGMLLAPAIYAVLRRTGRAAICCLCYGFILLYSCYDFQDVAAGKLESFVVGQRYLLTMMPLFVVSYAGVLMEGAERFKVPGTVRRLVGVGAILGLACVSVGIHFRHQKLLKESAVVRDTVGTAVAPSDYLICNSGVAKFFHPGWNHVQRYEPLPAQPEEIARVLDGALTQKKGVPPRRVIVAAWVRDYRTESGEESVALRTIENEYQTRPLISAAQSGLLPPGVTLFQIVGKREAFPAPAGKTSGTSGGDPLPSPLGGTL